MSGTIKVKNTAKKKTEESKKKSKQDEYLSSEEEKVITTKKQVKKPAAAEKKSQKQSSTETKSTKKQDSDSDNEDNIPRGKREAKTPNLKSKNEKTTSKNKKEDEEDSEHSDDEDLDEERAAMGEEVMNRMFGAGNGEKKAISGLDEELANMKLPSLSKMIPTKNMSRVIDSMTNDMLNNNNLDVDEIVEASMQAAGRKLKPQEKHMAKLQANKLLSQLNPCIQTCNFLCKILLLGIKYSKPGKHGKGISDENGMKEYHKLLVETLNNKNNESKMKYATSHSQSVKKLFEAYKEQIREYDNHIWLEEEGEIVLSYGKNQTAILPLSKIYSYISNLDRKYVEKLENNKQEKPEETKERKEVENDAGELDHHLWKIFSLATDAQDERTEYEERALHLVSGGDATKKGIVDVSRRLREKFIDDKSNYDSNGEVIPGVLVGKVIGHLDETGELNSTIKGVIGGLDKGNFDLMSTISQAKRDLLRDEDERKK